MRNHLCDLEEGKIYTISFQVNELHSIQKIECVRVLVKLENTIQLEDIDTTEIKWYRTTKPIDLLDEMPIKYLRKQKLDKIEESNEN